MEGPSLVILREELVRFSKKKILDAEGSSRLIDPGFYRGKKLQQIRTWGKHLILEIEDRPAIRIHFLMYGSYRINETRPAKAPMLSLRFKNGEVHFYTCSIRELPDSPDEIYDWSVDPMSEQWNDGKALRALDDRSEQYVCDVLLDQDVFAGVGNIIKNEVLHRLHLHPLTYVGQLSHRQRHELVRETRKYCFQFYEWKKKYELRKHWKVYRQRQCAFCENKPVFGKTGKLQRVSFICLECQPEPAGFMKKEMKRKAA